MTAFGNPVSTIGCKDPGNTGRKGSESTMNETNLKLKTKKNLRRAICMENEILNKIPDFQKIKDSAAKKEGYKDWDDMLRCLFDPKIGHPGMYTLDDIINNCLLDFYK